jgi:hypothetical protein
MKWRIVVEYKSDVKALTTAANMADFMSDLMCLYKNQMISGVVSCKFYQ